MNGYIYISLVCLLCLLAPCCAVHAGNSSQVYTADDTPTGPVCYSCDLLSNPSGCSYKVRCGRDELCMLHEIMPGFDGNRRYTAHCETDAVCQNMRNHAKKRAHIFCHNCCTKDLCNNHCGSNPTKPPTHPPTHPTTQAVTTHAPVPTTTPPPPPITTTIKPTVAATAAAHTHSQTHHVTYPIMCYSCSQMLDPSKCIHLVTCGVGHGCMLYVSGRDQFDRPLYLSSCEPDWMCNSMGRSADVLIGKRSEGNYLERSTAMEKRSTTCSKCCYQHLCNNHCDVPATATTLPPTTAKLTTVRPTTAKPTTVKPTTARPTTAKPTTVKPTTARPTTAKPTTAKPTTARPTTAKPATARPTTAKPTTAKPATTKTVVKYPPSTVNTHLLEANCIKHNFTSIPYINLCFKLENIELSWSIAERWCGFYGATLAVLDEPGKFSVIQTLLRFEPHFSKQITYIGANDRYRNNTLYWPRGNRASLGSWSGLNHDYSGGDCLSLDGNSGFEMKLVDCHTYRKFICTIDTS